MSALNDTLTYREVEHEWDTNVRDWETEHMNDDDIMRLRAETARMPAPRPTVYAQCVEDLLALQRNRSDAEWEEYMGEEYGL